MKTKIASLLLSLVAAVGLAQTSTLTVNQSTGLVNVPAGVTPNFAALKVGGNVVVQPATQVYLSSFATPLEDSARIDGFTKTLSNAGLLTPLVDAVFFRTGQNVIVSSAIKSYRGNAVTLTGSPVLTKNGMHFDGSTQYALFSIASTTDCMIGGEYQGIYYGQAANATPYSVGASALDNCFAIQLQSGLQPGGNVRKAGTDHVDTPLDNQSPSYWAGELTDPFIHTILYGVTTSSTTAVPSQFVDAITIAGHGVTYPPNPNASNRAAVGGRVTNGAVTASFKGWVRNMVIFNRALTQTECQVVETALRFLDHTPCNLVINGDSNTAVQPAASVGAISGITSNDCWVWQLASMPQMAQYRIYNMAQGGNGLTIDNGVSASTDYEDKVKWRALQPVQKTVHIDMNGTNELSFDSSTVTGAADYAYWQSIASKCQRDGVEFYGATVQMPNQADSTHQGYINAFNALLVANAVLGSQSVGLVRRDLLFPDKLSVEDYGSSFVHLTPAALMRLAHDVATGINRRNGKDGFISANDVTQTRIDSLPLRDSIALNNKVQIIVPNTNDGWSNTGGGLYDNQYFYASAATSASAVAGKSLFGIGTFGYGNSENVVKDNIAWKTPIIFSVEFGTGSISGTSNPNTTIRASLGKASLATGALSARGIGFELRALSSSTNTGNLYIVAHDGTTLTTSSSLGAVNLSGNYLHRVALYSDGVGNVSAYLDGLKVGAITGGPTANGGSWIVFENVNAGDTDTNAISFGEARVIAVQPK